MVCATSQEVCCSSSPQPHDPCPATIEVSWERRGLSPYQLPRGARLAGVAALRTRAVPTLRRARDRTCLERTEILSRGRAQAVSALPLPAALRVVEDAPCHPVEPGPLALMPRLGVQVPPARNRQVMGWSPVDDASRVKLVATARYVMCRGVDRRGGRPLGRGSSRRRLELEPNDCKNDLGSLRQGSGGPVCGQGQLQVSTVVHAVS